MKTLEKFQMYTIAVTGALGYLLSFGILWLTTDRMVEDVLFLSGYGALLAAYATTVLTDRMLQKIKRELSTNRGLKNVT